MIAVTLRTWRLILLLLTAFAPAVLSAMPAKAPKFVPQIIVKPVPGVVTPQAPPPAAKGPPPAPCSAMAIRTAAAQHVAPALKGCTLAVIQPYLNDFFKPAPAVVDTPDPAAVGIVVDQRPEAAVAVGDDGLVVYVGAIVQSPAQPPVQTPKANPKHDPKTVQQTDPTAAVPTILSRLPQDDSTIYPWWVLPSAIGLAIVGIAGLAWPIFRKRPDPAPEPDVVVPAVPPVHCLMESDRQALDRRDTLAETPHLTIAAAFEPSSPRISPIAIEHVEILP